MERHRDADVYAISNCGLPDYIENHYTTAFQLLGVDSNDPLLLSGWYCIAQWIERYVAANRPVSDKDILLLLQSNFDLKNILRLCELDSFPIASKTSGLVYLVNMVIRPFRLIGNRAVLFYQDTGENLSVLNGQKVALSAGIFSVLAICCYLLAYKLITERVPYQAPEKKEKQPSVVQMLKNAVKNRALISIIVASILQLLAQLTMQNMNSYIYPDYYGNAAGQSVSSLIMMGGMIIAAALTKPMTNKFGKAEVSAFSCILATVVCVITWLFKPLICGYSSLCKD